MIAGVRVLSGVAALSVALLATGCTASSQEAAGSSPAASPVSAPAVTVPAVTAPAVSAPGVTAPADTAPAVTAPAVASATAPAGSGPASAAPPATAGSTATAGSPGTCAQAASRTFFQVTTAVAAPDGTLTLTAHPATMVCGGPDDYHYNVAAATETIHALPSAAVQILAANSNGITDVPIDHAALPSYLAGDNNGRIFLVTGQVSGLTSLEEMFHP
jgi:hypothetical protein